VAHLPLKISGLRGIEETRDTKTSKTRWRCTFDFSLRQPQLTSVVGLKMASNHQSDSNDDEVVGFADAPYPRAVKTSVSQEQPITTQRPPSPAATLTQVTSSLQTLQDDTSEVQPVSRKPTDSLLDSLKSHPYTPLQCEEPGESTTNQLQPSNRPWWRPQPKKRTQWVCWAILSCLAIVVPWLISLVLLCVCGANKRPNRMTTYPVYVVPSRRQQYLGELFRKANPSLP
jgi:hypothetical protein